MLVPDNGSLIDTSNVCSFPLQIADWSIRTCINCWKRVTVRINKRTEVIKLREEDLKFEADTYYAVCPNCGVEVYCPELNDVNVAIRNIEYKRATREVLDKMLESC